MIVQSFAHATPAGNLRSLPNVESKVVTVDASANSHYPPAVQVPTPNHELDFAKGVIYGSVTVSPPTARYTPQERRQQIDAYAARVVTQIKHIESGEEGESNIRFQKTRQFLEPAGYFTGGLLAAGYDPHEKITVTFRAYTKELNGASHLTREDQRTYSAWEIAAGALKHDRPAAGGLINFQSMEIQPQDKHTINDLQSMGEQLQHHWMQEITKPMQDASGALAKRSGKADAYVARGILQGLRNDKQSLEKLTAEAREAISRTLDKQGNVVIPNIYGYPLAGYAFVPYINYHGDYDHRPNKGLMIDLKNGAVIEIRGDKEFAQWAGKNRNELLRGFNSEDRQGRIDAHWPRAVDVLDNLIAGTQATYPGYQNLLKDKAVPVLETFNYSLARKEEYALKFGSLDSGIAADYQAMNAKNAKSSDQTQVFGSSQQSWKAAKEVWGNTFAYVPIVGNTGNIVFGVHDAIYGMTAADRVGGTAAAVISGLQLVHETALAAAQLGLEEPPIATRSPISQRYSWKYDEQTSVFEFVRAPEASSLRDEAPVTPADNTSRAPEVNTASEPAETLPPVQTVEVGSTQVAGALEGLEARLQDPIGFGSRAMVYADPDDPNYVIKVTFPLPAAQRIADMKNEVKLFNQYYGAQRATFLGSNAADTVSYIRMPKVSGETLENLMAGGKALPEGVSGGLLTMLADMENAGIVHNDLAGRNILYDPDTQRCLPVDFGSAKSAGSSFAQSKDRYSIWSLREEIQPDGQSIEEMVEILESLKTNAIE